MTEKESRDERHENESAGHANLHLLMIIAEELSRLRDVQLKCPQQLPLVKRVGKRQI
jgi:hypothetical protein